MRATTIVSLTGSALLLAATAGGAGAGPVSGLGKLELLPATAGADQGGVERVRWGHRHHHWRHRWWGPRYYSYYGYSGCWWRHGRRFCSW